MPGIVNPLTAACDSGYVPDEATILSNPGVAESVAAASDNFETILEAYGGDPTVTQQRLDHETDFQSIIEYYRTAIEAARDNGDTVAIDVTPGRKFMSAIAFQAGFRFEADHVYYFHRKAGDYRGQYYPEMPRSATDLIDFTEVV
jgi:hypothetical protein